VEVCEQFVNTNWKREVAIRVEKIWVYERTREIMQLSYVCNDIIERYVK